MFVKITGHLKATYWRDSMRQVCHYRNKKGSVSWSREQILDSKPQSGLWMGIVVSDQPSAFCFLFGWQLAVSSISNEWHTVCAAAPETKIATKKPYKDIPQVSIWVILRLTRATCLRTAASQWLCSLNIIITPTCWMINRGKWWE